jgi:hypothetical protein
VPGTGTNSQGSQEEPFSPPELIPIAAGSEHLNPATATLSHDRQVSIDSCSNLIIDEQGSTTCTATTTTATTIGPGVGGGFPQATSSSSSSPSAGSYTALNVNVDRQQLHVGYGGVSGSTSSRNHHSSDQQGFTPFVLASEVMESGPPPLSQRQSNGSLRQTSSHSQQHEQQVVQEHTELHPQAGHHDDTDKNAASAENKEKEQRQESNTNKGDPPKQKRRHYNAYSSDDDDDVFLPNPPPKTQADRCTIAMETDEEKSAVAKEMEQSNKGDNTMIGADIGDSLMNDTSALSEGEMPGTVATETEGGVATTEEEVDVVNDSQTKGDETVVPLSSPAAIKTGNYMYNNIINNYYERLQSSTCTYVHVHTGYVCWCIVNIYSVLTGSVVRSVAINMDMT